MTAPYAQFFNQQPAPQQPQGYPAAPQYPAPAAPAQQFAPQQPAPGAYGGYPGQPMPQQPAYPPAPQYAPFVPNPAAPQYAPAQPQYANGQPGYGQQPAPQAPMVPVATGTLDDFFSQRNSVTGKGWSFTTPGETRVGMVSGKAVVEQDRDRNTGLPATFRDGSPKWVMIVPLKEPDGTDAKWYVRGSSDGTGRVELARAMVGQGLPENAAPEEGAIIAVTFHGKQAKTSGTNSFVQNMMSVTYDRSLVRTPIPTPTAPAAAPVADEAQAAPAGPINFAALANGGAPVPPAQQFQQPAAPAQQTVPQAPAQPTAFTQAAAPEIQAMNAANVAAFQQPAPQAPAQAPQAPAAPAQPAQQFNGFPQPAPQAPAQPAPAAAVPPGVPADQAAVFAQLLGGGQ